MAGIQLVFSFLFICHISCTASPSDLPSVTPLAYGEHERNYYGLAQIFYDNEGQICSGIHLKPWIVLTIADCVNGRDVNRLEVGVVIHVYGIRNTTMEGIQDENFQVQVDSVTIHYKYKKGVPKNNFALLYIYGKMDWEVYEFQFTSHLVTYDELMKNNTGLVVDKWLPKEDGDFYLEWKWFTMFKNDSLCGTCFYDNCYCGSYTNYNPDYYKRDVGTPMYYNIGDGDDKICLGLDTGTAQAEARVFQEIYSIKTWVMDFVHFHCAPPEGKL